ncbi:DoxX family protein [Caenispirillum salinarum]|uniref:DoxX family protein n=1 Tax=Caenispirillum salinarum TaxID=859058 RepID=UPI00384F9342
MADSTTTTDARTRPLLPFLAPLERAFDPFAWPLVRFAAGVMLIPHGWGKLIGGGLSGTIEAFGNMGFTPAGPLATYIGVLELVGGLCIAIGFLTRFWAAQVVGFMAVAAFVVHWSNGFNWTDGGYEYPLFWGLVALAITFRGAGRMSVDAAIGREL